MLVVCQCNRAAHTTQQIQVSLLSPGVDHQGKVTFCVLGNQHNFDISKIVVASNMNYKRNQELIFTSTAKCLNHGTVVSPPIDMIIIEMFSYFA